MLTGLKVAVLKGFSFNLCSSRIDKELESVFNKERKLEKDIRESRDEVAEKLSAFQREEQELKKLHAKMKSVTTLVAGYKKQIEDET